MTDRLSSVARSRLMGRVRHNGTDPEISLRRALWAAGLRYRLKARSNLPGSPDILFPGAKLAVFVDGCFWHGCPIHGTLPKTRTEFWKSKISRNRERDAQVDVELVKMGWQVVRLWEHQIGDELPMCVAVILSGVTVRRAGGATNRSP